MKALAISIGHDPSAWRERLSARRRLARRAFRRAMTVMAVLVLGGALHAMRLASMLVLWRFGGRPGSLTDRSMIATLSSEPATYRSIVSRTYPDNDIRETERVMNPLHSLTSLGLSVGVLAFAVWVALAHPAHQSVFGPPAPTAPAAVGHV